MTKLNYKTLDDKHRAEVVKGSYNASVISQFDIILSQMTEEVTNDKQFIDAMHAEYDQDQQRLAFEQEVEASWVKEEWEVPQRIAIGRMNTVPKHVAIDRHRREIKQALANGKHVPAEVLAEYPELIAG
jgi:hypothetical protein